MKHHRWKSARPGHPSSDRGFCSPRPWVHGLDRRIHDRFDAVSGARFSVAAPLATAGGCGNLGGTGQVFAAIVALSGPDDFPDSSDLSTPDIVGHAC